jgi:phosphoribosylformimino-5-aminoimidazole carboxamide ribotide isomerase
MAFTLLPAIDIRQRRVVRLSQGEAARETVYGDDPIAVAERFVAEGAEWLHVVDLDRAFGEGDNSALVGRLVAVVGGRARVQLGGGFRSLAAIEDAIGLGAARVVIGTGAVRDPTLVPAALLRAGVERVAVGIDARDGIIAIRGWREAGGEQARDVALRVVDQGVRTLVYTDVSRDGMLQGPDLDGAIGLQALGADVIASGGVSSLEDLRRIRTAGLAGAIVGRAIYEGRFTVAEAVAVTKARTVNSKQ